LFFCFVCFFIFFSFYVEQIAESFARYKESVEDYPQLLAKSEAGLILDDKHKKEVKIAKELKQQQADERNQADNEEQNQPVFLIKTAFILEPSDAGTVVCFITPFTFFVSA
jgi:hypothetical protein